MGDKPQRDQYGNIIGWETDDGRVQDKYGNTTGYKTSDGRTQDRYGNTTGHVTSDGRIRDKYGNTTGYVTSDGRVQDRYGNPVSGGSGSDLSGDIAGALLGIVFVVAIAVITVALKFAWAMMGVAWDILVSIHRHLTTKYGDKAFLYEFLAVGITVSVLTFWIFVFVLLYAITSH